MTPDELSAIEQRNQCRTRIDFQPAQDITALVAEVRRLQAVAKAAASYWIITRGQRIGGDAYRCGKELGMRLLEAGEIAEQHSDWLQQLKQAARPEG